MLLFGSGIFTMLLTFLRSAYNFTKRLMDIITSIIAIIILSPLCLMVAILIKLTSKGPIFYTQIRSGKDGKDFEIYKFRTMKTDAEKASGPVWAKLKDNRITPIGNILRKSRIDEIPQFINVLKGDMSVIGPRPERPVFVKKLEEQIGDYKKRLIVKPGITGLAQVYHRYDESIADVRKKVKYDILYIKKMCFWTDFRIIVRTFGVILTGFGAH
ncbi:MAG: exopolysaccharide biosynthesis polyprenyl glycosylphosphotransferase [Candidatus Omnitrophica bacterium]|nr:exopolysaccharide biosynthesis polyprenyl glycosylphosphotransferase [Candidatus Omnitrophota bacterium]